jgi:hypothetical protein
VPIGYMMEQGDRMIYKNMHGYSLAYSSAHWIFWDFLPGRPLDTVLKHTIESRFPMIGEWMGEPQGETYSLMIIIHLGYHQKRSRDQDTHRFSSRIHYDFLVMPSSLTNALVISQSCRQW